MLVCASAAGNALRLVRGVRLVQCGAAAARAADGLALEALVQAEPLAQDLPLGGSTRFSRGAVVAKPRVAQFARLAHL